MTVYKHNAVQIYHVGSIVINYCLDSNELGTIPAGVCFLHNIVLTLYLGYFWLSFENNVGITLYLSQTT